MVTRPRINPTHAKPNSACTKAELEARCDVLLAVAVLDVPVNVRVGLVAVLDRYNAYPGESPGPTIWSGREVAELCAEYYEDGGLMVEAGRRLIRQWRDLGILTYIYDHGLCTPPLLDTDQDPLSQGFRHEHDGGYHCRYVVTVRSPHEWDPPEKPPAHQRRQPYERGRSCPHCGANKLVPVRSICFGCGRYSDWNDQPKRSGQRTPPVQPRPPLMLVPSSTVQTQEPLQHMEMLPKTAEDAPNLKPLPKTGTSPGMHCVDCGLLLSSGPVMHAGYVQPKVWVNPGAPLARFGPPAPDYKCRCDACYDLACRPP